MVLSVVAVGCRPTTSDSEDGDASPTAFPLDVPAALALDLRFVPAGDAIDYSSSPDGCDQTVIRGWVRDINGQGVAGLLVHVWAEDGSWEALLPTDAEGAYSVAASQGLSEQTFLIQLIDGAGTTLLSDVIVAPAIPHCDLNMMTVNLVTTR